MRRRVNCGTEPLCPDKELQGPKERFCRRYFLALYCKRGVFGSCRVIGLSDRRLAPFSALVSSCDYDRAIAAREQFAAAVVTRGRFPHAEKLQGKRAHRFQDDPCLGIVGNNLSRRCSSGGLWVTL